MCSYLELTLRSFDKNRNFVILFGYAKMSLTTSQFSGFRNNARKKYDSLTYLKQSKIFYQEVVDKKSVLVVLYLVRINILN